MAAENKKKCLIKQGAEAKIYCTEFYHKPVIVKERFSKSYRHPSLDEKLTCRRTSQEVRALLRCRKAGIPTPCVYFLDQQNNRIYMERIEDCNTVRDGINSLLKENSKSATIKLNDIATNIGLTMALMHNADCIHGDLTTSNMLLKNESNGTGIILIDFGLSSVSALPEDKGVDLYVLERAFLSTHPNTEELFQVILSNYKKQARKADEVIKKLDEVRMRGRKRTMVG
jgi:TP53 regulating kinase-like protein